MPLKWAHKLHCQSLRVLEAGPMWELEGKLPPLSLLVFSFVAVKKATTTLLPLPSSLQQKQKRKAMATNLS